MDPVLVLDSGAVSRLADRSSRSAALIAALRRANQWPPVVPSVVLVECLTGNATRDADTYRFLRACHVAEKVPVRLAARAARLRALAGAGSAVDALFTAWAEPDGTVLTGDRADIRALAVHAAQVSDEVI